MISNILYTQIRSVQNEQKSSALDLNKTQVIQKGFIQDLNCQYQNGVVLDSDGQPISEAKVFLADQKILLITDEMGVFVLIMYCQIIILFKFLSLVILQKCILIIKKWNSILR